MLIGLLVMCVCVLNLLKSTIHNGPDNMSQSTFNRADFMSIMCVKNATESDRSEPDAKLMASSLLVRWHTVKANQCLIGLHNIRADRQRRRPADRRERHPVANN